MAETSVNAGSLTAEGSANPSSSGNNSLAADGRTIRQVMEENKRKAEEIQELRDQLTQHVEQTEERLAELSSKQNLNSSEVQEAETLQAQINAIKSNPKSTAWMKLNEGISETVADAKVRAENLLRAGEFVEDMAEVLKVDKALLEKELLEVIRGKWTDLMPSARIRKGFQEWKAKKTLESKLAKLEAIEKGAPVGSGEGGGRQLSSQTFSDSVAKAHETGNYVDLLKSIEKAQLK